MDSDYTKRYIKGPVVIACFNSFAIFPTKITSYLLLLQKQELSPRCIRRYSFVRVGCFKEKMFYHEIARIKMFFFFLFKKRLLASSCHLLQQIEMCWVCQARIHTMCHRTQWVGASHHFRMPALSVRHYSIREGAEKLVLSKIKKIAEKNFNEHVYISWANYQDTYPVREN